MVYMKKLCDILLEAVNEIEEEEMVNSEIIRWLERISVNVDIKGGEMGVDSLRRQFLSLIRYEGSDEYSRYLGLFFEKPNVFRHYVLEFINQNPGCVIEDELNRFGGNVEKMIKYHRDAWDYYSFEEFIKPEYMDRLLEFMLPNATFFRKLKMTNGGHLICHRAINIDKNDIGRLRENLGIYWTFGKAAFSYDNFFGEEFAEGRVYTITFHAEVPSSSVSAWETLDANAGNFAGEEEITIIGEKPVILYGVDVMDYRTKRKWKVPLRKRYICLA